jgi:replicative superfamily II helicase
LYTKLLYGAETWTLRKVDQKYLETFEMWCWRRMEISWIDRVRNEEVLHRVKVERNILHTVKRRKANWIGHILRRSCLLKHVIEGKLEGRIEITRRRGRRRKQLLDDLKEKRRYWKLKEEALDRTLCRTRFGRVYGLVVRQTTE